jgi:hypothetical protein
MRQQSISSLKPRLETYFLILWQMEEEDFGLFPTFRRFNLQTFQALKDKSNPKQATQNPNQAMEEEDFPFPTFIFLQSANNTNPKQQKQPKASFSKCNCNPSSSITQKSIRICYNRRINQMGILRSDFSKANLTARNKLKK